MLGAGVAGNVIVGADVGVGSDDDDGDGAGSDVVAPDDEAETL